MIQVVLEVRTGAARFRVSTRAQSIQRAMSIAGTRFPASEVRLVFPIESEPFFAKDTSGEAIKVQIPESIAV